MLPPGARVTYPQDLHLTLRFLGELDSDALERAEGAADGLAAQAVPLRIDRLGHFARSQVLWCGPSSPSPQLLALADRLEGLLAARGFAPEPRPFRAHITLARKVRRPVSAAWGDAVEWTARELVLAAGRDGRVPRYGVRRSWPLNDDTL
jgi:2'-5' RNA ligase